MKLKKIKTDLKNISKKFPILLLTIKYIIFKYQMFLSRSKWKSLKKLSEIKLELGSGSKKGVDGWTTVDIGDADIKWDLKFGIPLSDKSVDKIYSSHLLEHISYNNLIPFLKECKRVLKIGGEFYVCVPNFRLYIDAYKDGKLFQARDKWWQPAMINTGSNIDQLNYMTYMLDHHKYMFDEQNLINTLTKAGFLNVSLREFDDTLDLISRNEESIYAKAIK
jgi:predicted SAM-dependent methyltransferase